jgi:hypothetical protein
MEELPPAQIVFADKKLKSIEKQVKFSSHIFTLNPYDVGQS